MNRQITVAIWLLLALSYPALAGKTHLPARYVRTDYTLHVMTGLTSNERSKQIAPSSPIEITKITEGGKDYLLFRAPPRSPADQSDPQEARLEYTRKKELVHALNSLPQRSRQQDLKPQDAIDTLLEGENLKLQCIRQAKPSPHVLFELSVGQQVFVINDQADLRRIVNLLNEI